MTTDRATIRRAIAADAAVLSELGAATFTETFGHLYPPEDLQEFLLRVHSEAAWTECLTDQVHAVWLAELADKRAIGFVVVGACKLPVESRESTAGEVQQLYVLAEFHNMRLGAQLLEQGLAWLVDAGQVPIYIGVWSENYGAQRFYARYGFQKVGEYGFRVGNTVDHEFILKR